MYSYIFFLHSQDFIFIDQISVLVSSYFPIIINIPSLSFFYSF